MFEYFRTNVRKTLEQILEQNIQHKVEPMLEQNSILQLLTECHGNEQNLMDFFVPFCSISFNFFQFHLILFDFIQFHSILFNFVQFVLENSNILATYLEWIS